MRSRDELAEGREALHRRGEAVDDRSGARCGRTPASAGRRRGVYVTLLQPPAFWLPRRRPGRPTLSVAPSALPVLDDPLTFTWLLLSLLALLPVYTGPPSDLKGSNRTISNRSATEAPACRLRPPSPTRPQSILPSDTTSCPSRSKHRPPEPPDRQTSRYATICIIAPPTRRLI